METDTPPSPLTIAYICQYFPYLTETFVYREVQALREQGIEVITLSNRRPQPEQLSAEARPFLDNTEYVFPIRWLLMWRAQAHFLWRQPLTYCRTWWQVMTQPGESFDNRRRTIGHFAGAVLLAYRIRKQPIQHIHAHFAVNAATMALVIAALLNISFSFTVHNNIFTDQLILRQKLRRARFIISISNYSRDYLLAWAAGIPHLKDKIHIIRCGIAPESFTPQTVETYSKPQIFSLARLDEKKGLPLLVEACKLLRDRGCAFNCLIGGQGEQQVLLSRMIHDFDLQDQVTLLGKLYQEQVQDYFNRADIFVLPCITAENGDRDGIPVVLMEAMALACPVISTRVSGIPELITHEKTGLLVDEKSALQLAEAIKDLLDNRTWAQALGRNGRDKIVSEFNIHHSTKQLAALFHQYL